MTVEQPNTQSNPELEQKVFKVIVAFSQSLEKALIQSGTSLTDLASTLDQPAPIYSKDIKQIDQITIDNGNVGLYTVLMVRNVIQRADELAKQLDTLANSVKVSNQRYKSEIESLKQQLAEQKTSSNVDNHNNNNNNKTDDAQPSTDNNSNNNIPRNELKESKADWDTKYQTELQLNAMLSEFLKDDLELSGLTEEDLSSHLHSSNTPSSNNLTTSTSSTPNPLGSSGTFSSSSLGPSNTSPSASSGSLGVSTDSPSRQSVREPNKKVILSDLLDQIDLESNNNHTTSPKEKDKKKGKFKFF